MKFIRSFCTNTRLMGTMMLAIEWKKDEHYISHIFVLDFEGLGVTFFQELVDMHISERELVYSSKYGGLGGELVGLEEYEARYLLKKFIERNMEYNKPLPETLTLEVIDFYRLINSRINSVQGSSSKQNSLLVDIKEPPELMDKIIKPFDSEVEFVNYMIMRFIARDRDALLYFSEDEDVSKQHLTKINGTLLFNQCEKRSDGRYMNTCIYEDSDGYFEARIIVNFFSHEKKYRLLSFMVVDYYPISEDDVFTTISMPESIDEYSYAPLVYDNDISTLLRLYFPGIQENKFENGILFTKFRDDNSHVNCNEYYINNDIEFNIFVSEFYMFTACYDDETLMVLEEEIDNIFGSMFDEREHFEFQYSILLDFIESGSETVDEYLRKIR